MLVVNAALPANSVAELVALAKGKPGVYNYASAGIGSPAHLAGEMLNLLAGIKLTHVPYKGAAPGLLDVIAGNPHLIITSPISAAGHMNAGRVRALATTGTQRNPRLPDLPTIADTVPGYEISQTWGLAAPAGTPPAIVTRLSDETAKAMRLADVKERVLGMGAVPAGDTPAEFQAYIDAERQRLGEVIARTGHRADRLALRELAVGLGEAVDEDAHEGLVEADLAAVGGGAQGLGLDLAAP